MTDTGWCFSEFNSPQLNMSVTFLKLKAIVNNTGSGSNGSFNNNDTDTGDFEQRPLQHLASHIVPEGWSLR